MKTTARKVCLAFTLSLSMILMSACVAPERRVELQGSTPTLPTPTPASAQQPTIAASPVEDATGNWKVASNDAVTLTVTAPGASEVAFLYRPVIADEEDNLIQLKNLIEPTDRASSKFQTNLQTSEDFAGDVWAHVSYPDGAKKETEHLLLTTRTALDESEPNTNTTATTNAGDTTASNTHTTGANANKNKETAAIGEDESQRSDKATGGKLTRAALKPNNPDIRITVNVPAFLLTLWQNGKEVATYPVGVGREKFPVPIGEREANRIILNPAWIPPDSSWVRASSSVEPYERIPADDARNPLGKIKIPLGDAYLIHEAAKPSDIGSLVSHGCVRMLTADIFDLTQRIARARNLDISNEEISRAKDDSERRVVSLTQPIPVDINYDTEVVEGGTLYLYPDVYERGTATVGRLRDELNANGVDASRLDDATLEQMIERTGNMERFVVKLVNIKRGRALAAGRTVSIVNQSSGGQ